MNEIIITNSISEKEISVGFNLNDGNVPFPPIVIDISGDIDLNDLVSHILSYLELNRKFQVEYSNPQLLLEKSDKIKLIKETLDEIYIKFNSAIENANLENTNQDIF